MAYRSNKRRGRKTRKAEAPEMRYGVEGLNIHTYSKFPAAVQDSFVRGYEAAKSAYGRGAYAAGTSFSKAKKAAFNDLREHAVERDQLSLSEANDSGKAFREGVRAGIRVVQEEVGSGRTASGMRFNKKRRNAGSSTERRAEDLADRVLWESGAGTYGAAVTWITRRGTKEMRARMSSSGTAGKAFRKRLRQMAGFRSFAGKAEREGAFTNPRKRRNTSGYDAGWSRGVSDWDDSTEPGGREPLSSAQLKRQGHPAAYIRGYLAAVTKESEALYSFAESEAKFERKWDEDVRGWTNPRKRRKNVSEALYREAARAGLSRTYVDRVARTRARSLDEVPTNMAALRKDPDGNSYIPVRTAHNTHWHYTLKKQAKGWVAEFRRRDKQSKARYINLAPAASLKKTYYKTKVEAFRQVAKHIMGGKHAPYRNPGGRSSRRR
jgi:hypothetical protein